MTVLPLLLTEQDIRQLDVAVHHDARACTRAHLPPARSTPGARLTGGSLALAAVLMRPAGRHGRRAHDDRELVALHFTVEIRMMCGCCICCSSWISRGTLGPWSPSQRLGSSSVQLKAVTLRVVLWTTELAAPDSVSSLASSTGPQAFAGRSLQRCRRACGGAQLVGPQ